MKHIGAYRPFICTVVSGLVLAACGSGSAPADTSSTTGATTGAGTTTGTATTTGGGGGSTTSGTTTSGTGGSPITGICANNTYQPTAVNMVAFVDDWEALAGAGGAGGAMPDPLFTGWYSFADVVDMGADFTKIKADMPGAATTNTAGHTSGMNVQSGGTHFGAGFGFSMQNSTHACADISGFDGISFWAKGTVGMNNGLEFQAVIAAEKPVDPMPLNGGDCMITPSNPCYAFPSKTVTLTANWTQYMVKWSDLAGPVPIGNVILGFNWIMPPPAAAFDVWIDEVALYKGTAPPGAVSAFKPGP